MIHVVKTSDTNYSYIIEDGFRAIIVDPGKSKPVLDEIAKLELTPEIILLTHHHNDHDGGVEEILEIFPHIELVDNSQDSKLTFESKNTISILHTPGHMKNSCCFYLPKRGVVFTGDTLFPGICGRVIEGSYNELFLSLQKLKELPLYTKVLPGHEYLSQAMDFMKTLNRKSSLYSELLTREYPSIHSTIGDEINNNPFMTDDFEYFKKIRMQKG